MRTGVATIILLGLLTGTAVRGAGQVGASVRARVDADAQTGQPVAVHVVGALCDNEHQGIVPFSRSLGDGQNPKTNLYWGAAFGVRSFLERKAGWERVLLAVPAGGGRCWKRRRSINSCRGTAGPSMSG